MPLSCPRVCGYFADDCNDFNDNWAVWTHIKTGGLAFSALLGLGVFRNGVELQYLDVEFVAIVEIGPLSMNTDSKHKLTQ